MKKLYLLMPLVLFIVSCVKDNITPPPAAVKPVSVDNFNQSTYNSVFSLIKENRNPSGVNKRRTEVINLEVNEAMLYLEAALGAYLTDPELIPTNSTISTGFAAISYTTDQNGVKKLDQNAIDSLATALYNNCVSLGTQALAGQSGVKFLSMLDLNWTIDTTIGIVQVRPSYVFSTYTAYNYSNMQTNVGYSPYFDHGCGVANLNAPGGALQIINDYLNSSNNPNYRPITKLLTPTLLPNQKIILWDLADVNVIPVNFRKLDPNNFLTLFSFENDYYGGTMPLLWIGHLNECWETVSVDFYKNRIADFIHRDFYKIWGNNREIALINIRPLNLIGFFRDEDYPHPILTNNNNNILNPTFPATAQYTWHMDYYFGIPVIVDIPLLYPNPIRF